MNRHCPCGGDKAAHVIICAVCWARVGDAPRAAWKAAENTGRPDLKRSASRPLVAFARTRKQPVHTQTKLL
jgi:hypothetical protein